jgi:myosin heavy subunit
MGTLETILNLLKMKNEPKSYSVKMYAEMKLDDGRVVATEDEQFMIGSKVFAIGDDGEAEPLSAGSYTMENGNKLTIGDSSEILDLGEEKEAEDVEASEEELSEEVESKEEMAEDDEADVEDWAGMEKRIKNLEDAVADLKADKVEASAELSEEVKEENVEEDSKEDKTEMSNEVIGELMTQIEELKSKIVELSGEPAAEGINYNPEGEQFSATVDLNKLSINERTAYYINNK